MEPTLIISGGSEQAVKTRRPSLDDAVTEKHKHGSIAQAHDLLSYMLTIEPMQYFVSMMGVIWGLGSLMMRQWRREEYDVYMPVRVGAMVRDNKQKPHTPRHVTLYCPYLDIMTPEDLIRTLSDEIHKQRGYEVSVIKTEHVPAENRFSVWWQWDDHDGGDRTTASSPFDVYRLQVLYPENSKGRIFCGYSTDAVLIYDKGDRLADLSPPSNSDAEPSLFRVMSTVKWHTPFMREFIIPLTDLRDMQCVYVDLQNHQESVGSVRDWLISRLRLYCMYLSIPYSVDSIKNYVDEMSACLNDALYLQGLLGVEYMRPEATLALRMHKPKAQRSKSSTARHKELVTMALNNNNNDNE